VEVTSETEDEVPQITDRIHESVIIFSHKEKRLLLSEEFQSVILKGPLERVQDPFQSPVFYTRLFLVPKKTGGMRPVIDLSILNTFLLVPHLG
jgi:hypothetical protein